MMSPRFSRSSLGFVLLRLSLVGAPVVLGGCVAGEPLQDPDDPPPALALNVRFPADAPADHERFWVGVEPIPYCPDALTTAGYVFPKQGYVPEPLPPSIFDATVDTNRVLVASWGDPSTFGCRSGFPLVRFFRLVADGQMPPYAPSRLWEARNHLVAWAVEPARLKAYGPNDPPLELPAGYSLLRRSCGEGDRPWHWEVAPLETPVDLTPTSRTVQSFKQSSPRALLDQREAALLGTCGVTVPPAPQDLGAPVTFEQARAVALSEDGERLLYLGPIDPDDAGRGAPLREITLADRSFRQLAVIEGGTALQRTRGPHSFVQVDTSWVQVNEHGDGTVEIIPVPVQTNSILSPDGRWLASPARLGSQRGTQFWDAEAGQLGRACLDVYPEGWTGSSSLMSFSSRSDIGIAALEEVDPATCQVVASYAIAELLSSSHGSLTPAFGRDAPVFLTGQGAWNPEEAVARPFSSQDLIGLAVGRFGDATPLEALPATAGRVRLATLVPGAAFVWSQRCLGLFETVCSYTLHRIALPGGEDHVIAVSDGLNPVAVSANGRRLAIAARSGIYVRDLP